MRQKLLGLLFGLWLCASAQALMITGSFTGIWFDDQAPGQGFIIQVVDVEGIPTAVVYWFTFDEEGNQVWLYGQGPVDGATASMTLFEVIGGMLSPQGFDPTDLELVEWGTLSLGFDSCGSGAVAYSANDPAMSGEIDIVRLTQVLGDECTGGVSDNTPPDSGAVNLRIDLDASLESDKGDLSRDVVIAYRVERPRTGIDVIASKQSGEDGFFQLTLTAGKELEELSRGMDYVFVLDVSGSMSHDGKLRLSRNSIGAFVEALGPEDRFELITFNIAPNTMFNTLQPVTDEGKTEAIAFLESQRARGGTSLRPALTTAYRYRDPDRTLNVVVLSDGMTEQGEQQELLELVTQRPSGSRVFCIGVGNEVNRPLLNQLADEAGGLSAFISQGDDFQRAAQAFRRKLMRPAVNVPMLKIEGVEVYDVEPQTLPDLYHGAPLRVYGRYREAGNMAVTVDGDALGAPFEQSANVTLPAVDADNPEIERMWAFHRVQRLMGENRRLGENPAIVDEIVQLCEGYSIAGEYASFIVLENDQEYRRWKIDRRNASRIQRDRASHAAIRQQLEQMREQSLANLGPQAAQAPAEATPSSAVDPLRAQTVSSPLPSPSPSTVTPSAPQQPAGQSGGSYGGGAIDPLTAALAMGLAATSAAAWIRRRRRRKHQQRRSSVI